MKSCQDCAWSSWFKTIHHAHWHKLIAIIFHKTKRLWLETYRHIQKLNEAKTLSGKALLEMIVFEVYSPGKWQGSLPSKPTEEQRPKWHLMGLLGLQPDPLHETATEKSCTYCPGLKKLCICGMEPIDIPDQDPNITEDTSP